MVCWCAFFPSLFVLSFAVFGSYVLMYTCAVPSTLGLILVRGESKAKKKKGDRGQAIKQ